MRRFIFWLLVAGCLLPAVLVICSTVGRRAAYRNIVQPAPASWANLKHPQRQFDNDSARSLKSGGLRE
jgi:hypothetical protein